MLASASFIPLGFVVAAALFMGRVRGGCPGSAESNRLFRVFLRASALLGVGLVLLFGTYFFGSRRFFLPLSVLMAVAGAVSIVRVLRAEHGRMVLGGAVGMLLIAVVARARGPELTPLRRQAADRIAALNPHSVVIAGLDPVYAEHLAPPAGRGTYVPISRRLEFASKVIAPTSLADVIPEPAEWFPHRTVDALRAGAIDAVPWVAVDALGKVQGFLDEGKQVFVESSLLTADEQATLQEKFMFHQVAPFLFQLSAR